ncbi:hypothetical protein PsorP6_017344 [Peronosclerospora sorghi]|uniref:Uncharacterized protein n=1 Tax=Peronosclerospora sorghi TaxID=230839 RepID=A0ACC0WNQ0_9STRA|nr:hypothetical protein PsorP6_017344 [Peronosclerospora sorghi]
MTVKGQVPAQELYASYVKSMIAGFKMDGVKSLSVETALNNHLDDDATSSRQLQTGAIDNESAGDYAGVDILLTDKRNHRR